MSKDYLICLQTGLLFDLSLKHKEVNASAPLMKMSVFLSELQTVCGFIDVKVK